MRIPAFLAAAALLATLAPGASAGGPGTSKGGVTGAGSAGTSGEKSEQEWDESLVAKSKKVKPGNSHTNEDGVTVENNSDKFGETVRISPVKGDESSATTVQSKTGVEAVVSGVDGNDTISLGAQNTVTVSGTAGTVILSSSSLVTVVNTSTSGPSIVVLPPGGGPQYVAPGQTRLFNTNGN